MVLIAGIDVGTTSAIVLVSLDKEVQYRISKKNFGEDEMIKYISNHPEVVLIATDKAKIPHTIKKISSRLNIGVYIPKKDIPVIYKRQFYYDKNLKQKLENIHEMDAYISAVYAIDHIQDIFNKVDNITRDINIKIKILKEYFRNSNLNIKYIYENILKNYKDMSSTKKIYNTIYDSKPKRHRKRKLKSNEYIIVIKKDKDISGDKDRDTYRKVIRYMNIINRLTECIINKDKSYKIVPKISYVMNNKIKCDEIFIDTKDMLSKNITKYKAIYITKELEDDIQKRNFNYNKIYIAEDYEDLINIIIVNKYKKMNNDNNTKDYSKKEIVNKIKKIIENYRYK